MQCLLVIPYCNVHNIHYASQTVVLVVTLPLAIEAVTAHTAARILCRKQNKLFIRNKTTQLTTIEASTTNSQCIYS